MSVTRLAPSPTGALHLGNARTFLINWAIARQNDWQVLLRIEDLDEQRLKAGATEQAIDVLRWLGLDWDEEPIHQSADATPYREALDRLVAQDQVYPCRCTRSQILAASLSAPHAGDHELRYPGTCRPDGLDGVAGVAAKLSLQESTGGSSLGDSLGAMADASDPSHPNPLENSGEAWRFVVPDEVVTFNDMFCGTQAFNPQQEVGDFLVARKDGQPSYQLAVVVDDARQGVTHVVRGDDLLSCTARQIQLYRALDLGPLPTYTHLPLVISTDGRRLAKRHGDTRLSHYRDLGVRPERLIGLMAEWCGLGDRQEMTAAEFAERLELEQLPKKQVIFGEDEDSWLRTR